jgi:hypothetical protein
MLTLRLRSFLLVFLLPALGVILAGCDGLPTQPTQTSHPADGAAPTRIQLIVPGPVAPELSAPVGLLG